MISRMSSLSKASLAFCNNYSAGLMLFILLLAGLYSCSEPKEKVILDSDMLFYEIYVPHWGDDDALNNVLKRSDHLSSLFVDAVILSPLQPVSERMRIGETGSPYAISDYLSVNTQFGTGDDLHRLIDSLHSLDIMVFMDWFPAITAYDSPMADFMDSTAVDSVLKNSDNFSFRDVTLVDYQKDGARLELIRAMMHWVKEYHLDGFRVHHADVLPEQLLSDITKEVEGVLIAGIESGKIKDVFDIRQNEAFYDKLVMASKEASPDPLIEEFEDDSGKTNVINFTSNYVKHSQSGSPMTVFGNRYRLAFVLAAFLKGHLLLQGGQEIPVRRGVSIYQDRDIIWPQKTEMDFYRELILLKGKNKALQPLEGVKTRFLNSNNDKILCIEKTYKGHRVIGIFNFSGKSEKVRFEDPIFNVNDYQRQRPIQIRADKDVDLAPMQFLLFTNV